MKKNLLDTKTASWGELIKNGRTFMVPRFQRDYSWEEEHWDDLWYNLVNLDEEEFHYMGYLVLQNKLTNEYMVIDGQQRLTTLSIIALAVIQLISEFIENGVDRENNCVIAFRYNVIGGLNPNKLEEEYNNTAREVYNNKFKNTNKIFQNLKAVYISDEEFESAFATKSIITKGKGTRLVKTIFTPLKKKFTKQAVIH